MGVYARRIDEARSRESWNNTSLKKKLHWHTTFGEIELLEQVFRLNGHTYRPFASKFKVHSRQYSRPLQRAMVDFGADHPFEQACKKMQEHYGLKVSASMVRKITEEHAKKIDQWELQEKVTVAVSRAEQLIAEIDGSMIPIVETSEDKDSPDLRKTRELSWKEVKVCFARRYNAVNKIYAAVIGCPEEIGRKLYKCAKREGLTEATKIHALGDGAQWIVDQIDTQFGVQASFMVDFYHTCEYLAAASQWCDPANPKQWFHDKKGMLKQGQAKAILGEMKSKLSKLEEVSEDHELVKCIRYIGNRLKYMKYDEARKNDLPIGSGEIESSHRYIVQKRLKIPGAWWKKENAHAMLQLSVLRANGDWEAYWKSQRAA